MWRTLIPWLVVAVEVRALVGRVGAGDENGVTADDESAQRRTGKLCLAAGSRMRLLTSSKLAYLFRMRSKEEERTAAPPDLRVVIGKKVSVDHDHGTTPSLTSWTRSEELKCSCAPTRGFWPSLHRRPAVALAPPRLVRSGSTDGSHLVRRASLATLLPSVFPLRIHQEL